MKTEIEDENKLELDIQTTLQKAEWVIFDEYF